MLSSLFRVSSKAPAESTDEHVESTLLLTLVHNTVAKRIWRNVPGQHLGYAAKSLCNQCSLPLLLNLASVTPDGKIEKPNAKRISAFFQSRVPGWRRLGRRLHGRVGVQPQSAVTAMSVLVVARATRPKLAVPRTARLAPVVAVTATLLSAFLPAEVSVHDGSVLGLGQRMSTRVLLKVMSMQSANSKTEPSNSQMQRDRQSPGSKDR